MPNYAAVFIDHKEARIFHIQADKIDDAVVTAELKHVHERHSQQRETAKQHPNDANHFFHEVARSLEGADAILIVGPAAGKLDLLKHVHKHDAALVPKIVGVETVDHPTDGQLVAYAKKYFELGGRKP